MIQVPAVDYDGILQLGMQLFEVERGEFLPFGKDQQSVGVAGSCIRAFGKLDARRLRFLGTLQCCGIVRTNLAAFLQQRLD